MKHLPLETNQEALGVEFLGLQHLVGSSLVSLPLCPCAACANPGCVPGSHRLAFDGPFMAGPAPEPSGCSRWKQSLLTGTSTAPGTRQAV